MKIIRQILIAFLLILFKYLERIAHGTISIMDRMRSKARAKRSSFDSEGAIGKLSLVEILCNTPTIIEIGAHEGWDTQEFSLLFPQGSIYSFEAHPELYSTLHRRCNKLANVTLVCAALSNTNGVSRFHQSSGMSNGSGSLLQPTEHLNRHPSVFFSPEAVTLVPTITLDTYFETMGLDHIDLLWMDVQGAEKIVLKGGEKLLEFTHFIYAEVSETPLFEGATTYADLRAFLADAGFIVKREFLPLEWRGEGNILFENKNLK